jgi:hypothetical protein
MPDVDEAIRRGVHFLLRAQAADGSWSDWALPPGASDGWTTAYVARHLAAAHDGPAIAAAAGWLSATELPGGGWGYNDRVGCDADSTANAVLFLAATGAGVSSGARERLLAFQRSGGGFATYPPDAGLGSWGHAHADVTAVAAQALAALGGGVDLELGRALDYLRARRGPDGLWPSFWWRSPLYATAAALAVPGIEPGLRLSAARTRGAFERALLVDCLLADGQRGLAAALAAVLAAEQLPDGSWVSRPVLRLTDRACAAPWACADAGPLFADPRRLFTTATALRALAGAATVGSRPARWHTLVGT